MIYRYTGGGFIKQKKSIQLKLNWTDIKSPFKTEVSFISILSTEEPSRELKRYLLKSVKLLLFIFPSISVVLQASE
ncbi:hypothetical protein C8N37_103417 [Sphingobacterium faecium]|nr:hypothetical protein C8N37_103417 [Sphingobacterium faecium]